MHPFFTPVKQSDPQLLFQSLDMGADRRLTCIESLGCPGKVFFFGNGNKRTDLIEFHESSSGFIGFSEDLN